MRALIVDDERLARAELRRLLAEHPEIEIAGEARDADDAEAQINTLQPDLLFLDIQMPGRDGFALLEQIEIPPAVIFTTAYDEYALRAFDVSAIDYLLKPVAPERLATAVAKVLRLKLRNDPEPVRPQQVFVRDGGRCWLVQWRDIELLESEGNYTRLYFGSERPLIPRSLNALEERLDPAAFFRASRKHIVNLSWVESVTPWMNGGLMAKLKGGRDVEISRRQAARLREWGGL